MKNYAKTKVKFYIKKRYKLTKKVIFIKLKFTHSTILLLCFYQNIFQGMSWKINQGIKWIDDVEKYVNQILPKLTNIEEISVLLNYIDYYCAIELKRRAWNIQVSYNIQIYFFCVTQSRNISI